LNFIKIILFFGGLTGDFGGGNEYLESGNIVAGNIKIFRAILQTIKPHLSTELMH